MDATRALLDELMGKERNVPLGERSGRRIRYDDPSVCKYQLGGLCPHRLFKNTRSDLGPCQYEIHDDHIDWESIQAEYDSHDEREKERYERKLHRYLEDLIREMDRKIVKAKERAEKESAPRPIKAEDQVRLNELQQRAKEALEKSQQQGEEGNVDQSMMLAQQADAYKKQYDELYKRLTAPERVMTVCEICGVFINSTDNEQRRLDGKIPQPILDHLTGKQYLGWKAIREHFTKLQEKYDGRAGRATPGSLPPERERSDRERERSPRRDERERERYREDRDRDRYREDRDRYRDYDRERPRGEYDREHRRGQEVAPPRDLYSSREGSYSGGRDRDRYYEERDRRRY